MAFSHWRAAPSGQLVELMAFSHWRGRHLELVELMAFPTGERRHLDYWLSSRRSFFVRRTLAGIPAPWAAALQFSCFPSVRWSPLPVCDDEFRLGPLRLTSGPRV